MGSFEINLWGIGLFVFTVLATAALICCLRRRLARPVANISTDINQQITSLTDRLRQSNEDLEKFAYAASHDLKEPLRMITTYLAMLQRSCHGTLAENERQYLRFALEGAQRASRLVDSLLQYSRLGREQLNCRRVDLNAIVQEAMQNLAPSIKETGAEIEVGALPIVDGDPVRLTQLLQNLLSNALKFSVPGKKPHITISASQKDPRLVTLSVQDRGIGIRPSDCGRIFETFIRLQARSAYPGEGIGLAICKRIVEQHEGKIWVESEEGQGANFLINLPRKRYTPTI